MTATVPPPKKTHDPDEFRMTIGEHLEELRSRVLRGLAGFIVALIIVTPFAKHLLVFICRPMVQALQAHDLNPQLFTDEATEVFMAWVQVSMICAVSLAGPWLLYQLWAFIAAGLYPRERKSITRYVPLAITLFFTGMGFVYWIVLPLTMRFFVAFALSVPLDLYSGNSAQPPPPNSTPSKIEILSADPPNPQLGQIWVNSTEKRLKFDDGTALRNIPFGGDSMFAIHYRLSDYLDLVFRLLITFGLCFQLPLVVMGLAKFGILDINQLRYFRRHVYFGMLVLAAVVSPGDVVTATIALWAPLILLYEFGILLAKSNARKEAKATVQ
jgi:sec-independent protein translocase protein TatC